MAGVVGELLSRSNRLGSDPRNTNYAGGNTSAKGTTTDPVTRKSVKLLWVKGSGGHGIAVWGQTSEECEAHSLEIIATAQKFIGQRGNPRPFGEMLRRPLPETERRQLTTGLLIPVDAGVAAAFLR